jgi:hypothetical protein
MNRQDVHLLQQIQGYPALTITLPAHRTAPENRQDPIRLRNLVTKATSRLLEEFSKREAAPLLSRLEKLADGVDHTYALDGLALFVNRDFARAFQVPFTLKERVVVDDDFFTRDLVFAMNRTPRYWALVLSEKPTHLYEGTRDTLVEVTEHGFPMTHEGPGGEQPLPRGMGINTSAHRDERHRQFFRQVDEGLKRFMSNDPLPLAVVGVDRYLSFFQEISEHRNAVVATLTGNHDKTSAHELGALVWPPVKAGLAERRQQVLQELDKAIGERKVGSGIIEVWRLAHEGRGRLLLVEEDYHAPGTVDGTAMHLKLEDDATAPGVMDDAVDEIIEMVLAKQGRVVFVENGQLKDHQRIALVLRY